MADQSFSKNPARSFLHEILETNNTSIVDSKRSKIKLKPHRNEGFEFSQIGFIVSARKICKE